MYCFVNQSFEETRRDGTWSHCDSLAASSQDRVWHGEDYEGAMHVVDACLFVLFTLFVSSSEAQGAFCEGASHIGCFEGVDQSGRSPGALYNVAVEGLKEARTMDERALAHRAIKDAFDPKMSNQRAVECNRNPGAIRDFAACVAGTGPAPGMKMTISCQQNLSDGRVLVYGLVLPAGARYKVLRYQSASTNNGWSYGSCELEFTRRQN